MKFAITGLLICAATLAGGCASSAMDGLNRTERAGIVRTDSSCDRASPSEKSDPASHCFVSRRGSAD